MCVPVFQVMLKTVSVKTDNINYRMFILWKTGSHYKESHMQIRKGVQYILKEPMCTTVCRLLPIFLVL